MKKFLFLLMTLASFWSYGQTSNATNADVVVLNELYTDPNRSTNEFMEFFNSSLKNISMDDYTVLIYFEEGSTYGFYVIDLPNQTVNKNSFYVLAPISPFNAQANIPTDANLAWSSVLNLQSGDSYLQKWVHNASGGYSPVDITSAEVNNIIKKKSGPGGQFHVLIFDGQDLVNFFVGGYSTLPSYVATWENLTIPHLKAGNPSMPNKTLTFSNLLVNNVESVISNTGSDNGYRRTRNGQCGTWVKSSSGSEHTPGYTNGAISTTGSLNVNTQLTQAGPGSNTLIVRYKVSSSTDPNVWPVTVRIVNDYAKDSGGVITDFVDESKLPEGRLVSYNAYDEEEPASSTYPLNTVGLNDSTFKSYFTSPIFTVGAYLPGYSGSRQPRQFHVFYQAASGCFDQVNYAEIAAIPLPVSFKSFTAKRNKQNVVLSWQTATELNNAGFAIERNINGNWTEIAFVPSQANGGNSSSELSYSYNDLNNHKGISQYRIRQTDIDAKTSYSVIRSVQGEGAGPKLVIYPNPSVDGRVQLVFEDANSTRHIVISDMSGRIIRQFSNVLNSSMSVDGLNPGLYTARVIDQATGESTLQKFVIQQK